MTNATASDCCEEGLGYGPIRFICERDNEMSLITIKIKRSKKDIASVIKNVETLDDAIDVLRKIWDTKGPTVEKAVRPITNAQLKEAHDSIHDYLPSDVEPTEGAVYENDEATSIPKWL